MSIFRREAIFIEKWSLTFFETDSLRTIRNILNKYELFDKERYFRKPIVFFLIF